MTKKKMIDWYLNFTDEQKDLVGEMLIVTNNFIETVPPEVNETESRKAAFITGFFTGFSVAGGKLPPEPPTEN